jgi:hypothetical protein
MQKEKLHIPLTEKLKSIPSFFGIHFNETPKYKILKSENSFELREYEPFLSAQTTEWGSYEMARKQGFLKLAGYIFGQNKIKKNFAMTSPVFFQDGSGHFEPESNSQSLTISFVLPSELTGKAAPTPDNSSIQLFQIPLQTWAINKYSGKSTTEQINEKSKELLTWATDLGYQVDLENLRLAQYDSPMTIPFLRHNEVQLRVWSVQFQ